jgi:hypothetical protein
MNRFTRFLKLPNVLAENVPVVQPVYQSSIFHMPNYQVAAETERATHPFPTIAVGEILPSAISKIRFPPCADATQA